MQRLLASASAALVALVAACMAPPAPESKATAAAGLTQANTIVGVHTAGDQPRLVTDMLGGRHGWTTELASASAGGVGIAPETVREMTNAGLSVILRIDYKPGANIPQDEAALADFTDSIKNKGGAFYDQLGAIVIGNEPNFYGECHGFAEGEPLVQNRRRCPAAWYAKVYVAARDAIRRAGSQVPVLVAGMSPGDAYAITVGKCDADALCECKDGTCTYYVRFAKDVSYYREVLGALKALGQAPDGVSVHAYGGFGGGTTPLQEAEASFDSQATAIRAVFPGTPLYITELAAHTCLGTCPPEARPAADAAAADFVRQIYPWLERYGNVRAATWFIFADVGNSWPTRIRWVENNKWHVRDALWKAFGQAAAASGSAPPPAASSASVSSDAECDDSPTREPISPHCCSVSKYWCWSDNGHNCAPPGARQNGSTCGPGGNWQ